MVQIGGSQAFSIHGGYERPDPDEYWKLVRPYYCTTLQARLSLKCRQFPFERDASYNRLLELDVRCQRNLLPYDGCSKKELRRFVAQRKLPSFGYRFRNSSDKTFLVYQLETADDLFVFDRFLSLPAELRKLVYKFSFAWMTPTKKFMQPPVTRASRQLRNEALPVFYRTCTFPLYVNCTPYQANLLHFPIHKVARHLSDAPYVEHSDFFFLGHQPNTGVPAEYLARMKNLHITTPYGSSSDMEWLLRIRAGKVQIVHLSSNQEVLHSWVTERPKSATRLLEGVADKINVSCGSVKFQMQDLIDVVAVLDGAFSIH